MVSHLIHQLPSLGHGDHACLIYDSQQEQLEIIVPFIKEGLERNERCIYIVHENSIEEMSALFASAGIDVGREQRRGSLVFQDSREIYLSSAPFDPDKKLELMSESARQAVADGFSGLRSVSEMNWVACEEPGCERAAEYEAKLNGLVPNISITSMCQYNRGQTSPSIIRNVLRTHPLVVIGGKARRNIYYEPAEIFLNLASDSERVEWMMGELKKAPVVTAGSPVLVVEDDQDIRRRMERNLEALGYNVMKAEDADEALKLATCEHPYFILTNSDLPWLGNLIQLIRTETRLRDVPFVAIYPNKPEEFRDDRIVLLDDYDELEQLWPSKAAMNNMLYSPA